MTRVSWWSIDSPSNPRTRPIWHRWLDALVRVIEGGLAKVVPAACVMALVVYLVLAMRWAVR